MGIGEVAPQDEERIEEFQQLIAELSLLGRKADEIQAQCLRILEPIKAVLEPRFSVRITQCQSQVGSGALPVETMPSFAIAVTSQDANDKHLRELASALRRLEKPVIGSLHNRELVLDLRCLEDEKAFVEQLSELQDLLA